MMRAKVNGLPLPPEDRALPGLRSALRGDAVGVLLAERLWQPADALELVSCTPCYVRYKPGTNCLVQYRLRLRELRSRRSLELPVHAKLYADGRAERLWSKGTLRGLARRAAELNPDPPVGRALHLPELKAIVQVYPVDATLPSLARVASEEGMRAALHHAAIRTGADALELVRYKPARKALLRCPTRGLFAKLHVDWRGRLAYRAGRALLDTGCPVAEPIMYLPNLRMVVHAEAAGRRLGDDHDAARLEAGAEAAGALLARLHATSVAGLPVHTLEDEAACLIAAARAIAAVHPRLADSAFRLAAECSRLFAEVPAASATCHGDFDDDQVLVSADDVVLLDLDSIRVSHPLLDVGRFLARLSTRGSASAPRLAFLGAYGEASGARIDSFALFEAAALLRLAIEPFRRLDPAWPEAVEERLHAAGRRLREYRPGRPAAVPAVPAFDPSLPQLAVLTDASRIGPALAQARGERVEVAAVALVRHKPGRRCTVRLDVAVGPPGARRRERLYAKTYASGRAPRVYRSLQAIARARAFGPAVALPEPRGCLETLKTVVYGEVDGEPAGPALLAGDAQLGARIATAVHALHASDVELERCHSLADELAALRGRVEALAEGSPTLAAHARDTLALADVKAREISAWRRRPVHRDFYPDQVLVEGRRLAVLDLDDAAMSEPALDVANFLAHLRLLDLGQEHSGAAATAASAFFERYVELDPALDLSLLRLLEGATLLRLACIHRPRERGERLAERLVEESEALIGE